MYISTTRTTSTDTTTVHHRAPPFHTYQDALFQCGDSQFTFPSFPLSALLSGRFYEGHHPEMTASNTVFTVFSGFGLVLSLIPLWWHLESWNVGTCMFMIWTALASFVYFVDSILWSGNTINWAPVWCDIGTFRMSSSSPTLIYSVQLFVFKLVLVLHGLLVPFVLSDVCTISLVPCQLTRLRCIFKFHSGLFSILTSLTETPSDDLRPAYNSRNPCVANGYW